MVEDLTKLSNQELITRVQWYEKKYGNYFSSRGLDNFKNLFRKPNSYEWTILFMMLMIFIGAWAYYTETDLARQTLENLPTICSQLEAERANSLINNPQALNISFGVNSLGEKEG